MGMILLTISLVTLSVFAYFIAQKQCIIESVKETKVAPSVLIQADQHFFRCDERKYCSQMKSAQEALFFQKNCSNIHLEIDQDGTLCNGYFQLRK